MNLKYYVRSILRIENLIDFRGIIPMAAGFYLHLSLKALAQGYGGQTRSEGESNQVKPEGST